MSRHPASRRHDVDTLRAFSIISVVLCHAASFFTANSMMTDQAYQSARVADVLWFFSTWRMPLLFFIAGFATHFSLRGDSALAFVTGRALRLLVPLACGLLVLIPPQVYFLRLHHREFSGGIIEFYRRHLASLLFGADLCLIHLWFIAYLFAFTLAILPLVLLVRGERRTEFTLKLEAFFGRGRFVYLLALPIVLAHLCVRDRWTIAYPLLDSLKWFVTFLLFYAYGYFAGLSRNFWAAVETRRGELLTAAALALAVGYAARGVDGSPFTTGGAFDIACRYLLRVLHPVISWLWVLVVLGYGARHLHFRNRVCLYLSGASYPLYLLHFLPLTAFGFYVLPLALSPLAKFLLLSGATLATTLVIYHFVISRNNVLRLACGLKPRRRAERAPRLSEELAGAVNQI